ncbi:MAG: C39 family peptidase [Butyrivibrio sp.]|nr:C39 family peptidase [Butyrivibrio sp.]
MADDFSTRSDVEQDAKDLKNDLRTLGQPLENKIRGKINDEIGDRIAKHIAENGAKEAGKAAAQTAGTATATGTAAQVNAAATGEAAAGSTGTAVATTGGTAVAETAGATGATAGTAAGTAVAEGATAGAAAGPVGIVVGAIVAAALAAAKGIKNDTDIPLDNDNPDGEKINFIFIIVACLTLFFVTVCGTLISKGVSAPLSVGQETEFQETKVNGENMSAAGEQYKEGTELKDFKDSYPLENAICNYTYGEDGKGKTDGLRATLDKALRNHCQSIVKKLEEYTGTIAGHEYDKDRSLKSFYDNRFPYDLASDDGYEPTIGDVLVPEQTIAGTKYNTWNPRYDDVNFAEFFAVMGMSDSINGATYGFDWGDINYKDFMEFLQKEECYKYMYELGLKWVPVYVGVKEILNDDGTTSYMNITEDGDEYNSSEECASAPLTRTFYDVECTWDNYYVKVTVKPYGLRELFAIAFNTDTASTTPTEVANRMHINFDQHTNLYMLNYCEKVTRFYQRGYKVNLVYPDSGTVIKTVDALGPSYLEARSTTSPIYDEVNTDSWLVANNWNGTGRSAWCYIEDTYNDDLGHIEWGDDPGGAEPPGGEFEAPDEGKILDMYEYINQGDYPNTIRGASSETVKQSGCLDCSIAMILMYYSRSHIPITDVSKYVNASGSLETGSVLSAYGFHSGGNHYSDVINGIINEINNDRPVVIHIRGQWTSCEDGRVLHGTGNGHFLVGIGYDSTGLYVYDPGRRLNYHIAYADWAHVNDLYYRPIIKD